MCDPYNPPSKEDLDIKILPLRNWSLCDETYQLAGKVADQIEERKKENVNKWAERLSRIFSKLR